MAIEFYVADELRLSLSEKLLTRLEGAQQELKEKTGLSVDLYSTTVLAPEHAALWYMGLKRVSASLSRDPAMKDSCEALLRLLAEASRARVAVRIEGE